MNYYLDDIRTILINEGYSNIKINATIEDTNDSSIKEFINLASEGGLADPIVNSRDDFSVYVYRKTNQGGITDSKAIWAILNGYSGGLTVSSDNVQFRRITTRNKPFKFAQSTQLFCYLATYTADISDADILQYK